MTTDFSKSLIGGNLIVALVMDISLTYLWQAINTAQLIEFLKLICGPMPENTKVIFRAMSFANGDFEFVNILSKNFSEDYLKIEDERLEN